jgi:hypothetical protein
MVLVDMVNLDDSLDTMLKSDSALYISGNVERNIPPPIIRQALKIVENTIKTGDPIPNSRIVIKNLKLLSLY